MKIGLIGTGAFGAFMLQHLAPHFEVLIYDPHQDTSRIASDFEHVRAASLESFAECRLIILSVPVQKIAAALHALRPHLTPGTTVIDVASVKVKPVRELLSLLPDNVSIVGTHPLFGPQSGKNGIAGLNLAICPVRGTYHRVIKNFCRKTLNLNVIDTTPECHDREMAFVMGVTHLIGRAIARLDKPDIQQTTKSFERIMEAVDMVKDDSLALFAAIERENPYVEAVKKDFFQTVRALESELENLEI